jgi:hypothetical protein
VFKNEEFILGKLNLQVNSIAYEDLNASNNPLVRNFDLQYKVAGLPVQEAISESFLIPPSATVTVFDGTRTTAIASDTAFTSSKPDPNKNIYRFTYVSGTNPVFRNDRAIGIDNTSVFAITVNGPIATLTNTGGTPIDTTSVQVGDILNLLPLSGASIANRGKFTILSKTATSLTYQNLNAVAQTFTVNTASDFLVYSNGTVGNQIQVGDKVKISAGFSSSVFGTYSITEVTPSWFEISVAAPNGIPLETSVTPGVSGLVFYSSAKKFVLIAAQDKCAARFNGDIGDLSEIEPEVIGNPEKPALLLKQGSAFSLVIKNLSLSSLKVLVASAE